MAAKTKGRRWVRSLGKAKMAGVSKDELTLAGAVAFAKARGWKRDVGRPYRYADGGSGDRCREDTVACCAIGAYSAVKSACNPRRSAYTIFREVLTELGYTATRYYEVYSGNDVVGAMARDVANDGWLKGDQGVALRNLGRVWYDAMGPDPED